MTSSKKDKEKKSSKRDKISEEEPEICLFRIPTFKPKAFTSKDELTDLKNDKAMDLKLFDTGMNFYDQGKKKVKRSILYDDIHSFELVEGSPELVRFITKSKGKKVCYQIIVADGVNRQKLYDFLKEKKGIADRTPPSTKPVVEEPAEPQYKPPPAKNTGFGGSEFSKNDSSERSSNYNNYEPPNKYRSATFKPSRRGSHLGHTSESAFDRRSRSTALNAEYYQDDDDFNSVNDQIAQSTQQEYAPSRWPESSYYARSRISYDTEYVDDDYDGQTSGYGYDDSDYSDETIVVRPVKPRSLTFYTPFVKVQQSRGAHY